MRRALYLGSIGLALLAGCSKQVPPPAPPVVQPPAPITPAGVWEAHGRQGNTLKMILKGDGSVIFQGGLEYLNPGQWDWNPMRKQLTLTLPRANESQLQVFQLSVGDGVKYFDPRSKAVTYDFTDTTDSLNVAGWMYTRGESGQRGQAAIQPEPTLK
jgi:hypothetical protein